MGIVGGARGAMVKHRGVHGVRIWVLLLKLWVYVCWCCCSHRPIEDEIQIRQACPPPPLGEVLILRLEREVVVTQ